MCQFLTESEPVHRPSGSTPGASLEELPLAKAGTIQATEIELNYNISFKAIHNIIDINEDFKNWSNCDFNIIERLNHYGGVDGEFEYNLLSLEEHKLYDELPKMLNLYIEPFNNSFKEIIEFINKGRLYEEYSTKNIYVEPYRFLPKAKKFLLENGMRPIEEFFE